MPLHAASNEVLRSVVLMFVPYNPISALGRPPPAFGRLLARMYVRASGKPWRDCTASHSNQFSRMDLLLVRHAQHFLPTFDFCAAELLTGLDEADLVRSDAGATYSMSQERRERIYVEVPCRTAQADVGVAGKVVYSS